MKKLILASAAIMAISSTANAVERFPNWYLGLSGGLTHQEDSDFDNGGSGKFDYDSGYVISGQLGYQPPSFGGFRVEAEIGGRKQDLSGTGNSGEVKATTYAANAFYDFYNDSTLTPYLGAGLGVGKFEISGANSAGANGSDTVGIYQLMAGVGYETKALPNVQWTAGYRYLAPFSDPSVEGGVPTEFEYDNHSLELGAKFRF